MTKFDTLKNIWQNIFAMIQIIHTLAVKIFKQDF